MSSLPDHCCCVLSTSIRLCAPQALDNLKLAARRQEIDPDDSLTRVSRQKATFYYSQRVLEAVITRQLAKIKDFFVRDPDGTTFALMVQRQAIKDAADQEMCSFARSYFYRFGTWSCLTFILPAHSDPPHP
jgi:hypothetical protein